MFDLDNDAADLVSEHIRTCKAHPMRTVEAEADKLRAENERLREAILTLVSSVDDYASSLGPVRTFMEFDVMMYERDNAEAFALRTDTPEVD